MIQNHEDGEHSPKQCVLIVQEFRVLVLAPSTLFNKFVSSLSVHVCLR